MPLPAVVTATVERAVRTAAQTALATIGTTAAISGIDWTTVGDVTGLATILSVLTSVATAFGTGGDVSLANERVTPTVPKPHARR